MNPLISVVITTYYRNELLEEAIESVLAQDYEPVELVVVDDSGEGNAEPVLDRYGDEVTSVIRDRNGGCSVARTDGIERSTGEYVHFLDDDDLFLEGKLSKTVDVLVDDPDVGVAYSGVRQDNGWQRRPPPEMSGDVLERTLRFETFPCYTGSMLIERDLLAETIPLAQFTAANDSDLMIQLARRTRFDYVDEVLTFNRRSESRTWTGLNKIEGMKQVIDARSDVYDRYPEIRRAVLAEIYYKEGHIRLIEDRWTTEAIACFARAARSGTENRLKYGGALIASLFGRPGVKTAANARDAVGKLT